MFQHTSRRWWSLLGALILAAPPAFAQEIDPAAQPAEEAFAQAAARDNGNGADRPDTPSDAEKIARLQRAIEETTGQVNQLTEKLKDPASEFQQAESAFSQIDQRLAEIRKLLAGGSLDATRKQELERESTDLEPKHKLAKERFDLAIKERKTLSEQIATLQQKIQQDTDALKKLKGESAPASQPALSASPSPQPAANGAPAETPTTVAAPAGTAAPVSPLPISPMPAQSAAPNGSPNLFNGTTTGQPAPELVEARQQAERKQADAKSAEEDVASLTERIGALRKSIELEQRLFETSRKKAENAQATERALYETLQKKWQDGSPAEELNQLRAQIAEARERSREAQTETRDRTDRLDKYQAELSALQSEQIAAMEEAQQRKSEAEQAKEFVKELESPLSPRNLLKWLMERGPRVAGIIIAMFVALWITRLGGNRIARLIAGRGDAGSPADRENRIQTLVGVFHSAVAVVIYAGSGLMILTEVGVNIVPLMGGAAVLGLAVAFGAQNLIRDYFNGFMILLENQYGLSDVVRIGEISGQVERITLRCTTLRSLDGTVHFIPNGEIDRVSNLTHGYSRALFDIGVAYKEDVDRVMHELVELAKELRRDPEYRSLILEMPEMLGVDEFGDSAVIIKFFIKTKPLKQFPVKRELLRRIKKRFDEVGIEIPFPHRTVYHRHENGAEHDFGSVRSLPEGISPKQSEFSHRGD